MITKRFAMVGAICIILYLVVYKCFLGVRIIVKDTSFNHSLPLQKEMECVPTTICQRFSSLLVLEVHRLAMVGLHRWGQLVREINYSSLIESNPGSV